jgi:hypothetical protein
MSVDKDTTNGPQINDKLSQYLKFDIKTHYKKINENKLVFNFYVAPKSRFNGPPNGPPPPYVTLWLRSALDPANN